MIGTAIQQRSEILEDYPILDLLLRCGKPSLAAEHIRDGNKLRVKTEQALLLSTQLVNVGLKREARRIFELSEPLESVPFRSMVSANKRLNEYGDW